MFLEEAFLVSLARAAATPFPEGGTRTNTVGNLFIRIEPGTFLMGFGEAPFLDEAAARPERCAGDYNEWPNHEVRISQPFYMSAHPVTNAAYEQFEPDHRAMRGKLGFSKEDDEAAVFVDWHDAMRYCAWLTEKEGLPYRLPTEAEWEYACRAGTTTHYHTGDRLPDAFLLNARRSWYPDPARSEEGDVVLLRVGQTPVNPWGLMDMHGLVEEWCLDWHGPYAPGAQDDPVGREDGDFRSTRGGSHSTEPYYLRSANRAGALPEEKSWLIGFRPVIGPLPASAPLPKPHRPLCRLNVEPKRAEASPPAPQDEAPFFAPPRNYIKVPPGAKGPLFSHHNHVAALAECPNGDLLASWYSCLEESGREVSLLAARLRKGRAEWEDASLFWDAPDRTMVTSALWLDEEGRLLHFVGLSAAATWGNVATVLRTSTDSGASWSRARIILPNHGIRQMPIESIFRAQDGRIVLPCDAVSGGEGGTALYLSEDEGLTWRDAGGTIAGIHAGVVQRSDGSLLAFGRGDNIEGMMPMSISRDMGKSWRYAPSPFPPIHSGQRLVLKRLKSGVLFFAAFANEPMPIRDASGRERPITGLYCAASFDEGGTWPVRKLMSDNEPERLVETMDGYYRPMSPSASECAGYLASCQGADGRIHLISSRLHYVLNTAWLRAPSPAI